jgi:hypothetical protein
MPIPRFNAAAWRQNSFRNLDVADDLLDDNDTPRFAEVVVSKKTTDLDDSNAQQNETPIREANAPQEETTRRPHGKRLLAKPVAMESSSASWLELSFNAPDHSSVALNASQSAIDATLEQHKTKQKKEKRRDGERGRRSKRSDGSERPRTPSTLGGASRSTPKSLRSVSRSPSTCRTPRTRRPSLISSKKGSDNTDPSCPGPPSKTTTKVLAKLVNRLSVERSQSISFSADNETSASAGRLSSRKSPTRRKLTRTTSTIRSQSMTSPLVTSTPRYSTRSGRRRHEMGRKDKEENDLRIRARHSAILSSIDACLEIH